MDKTERGTKEIVAIRSVKTFMMNINKTHVQVKLFTFNNLGFNKNGKISVFLIKHGVKSLYSDASVYCYWFKYTTKFWWMCLTKWYYRYNKTTKHITLDQLHGQLIYGNIYIRGNMCIGN